MKQSFLPQILLPNGSLLCECRIDIEESLNKLRWNRILKDSAKTREGSVGNSSEGEERRVEHLNHIV